MFSQKKPPEKAAFVVLVFFFVFLYLAFVLFAFFVIVDANEKDVASVFFNSFLVLFFFNLVDCSLGILVPFQLYY